MQRHAACQIDKDRAVIDPDKIVDQNKLVELKTAFLDDLQAFGNDKCFESTSDHDLPIA